MHLFARDPVVVAHQVDVLINKVVDIEQSCDLGGRDPRVVDAGRSGLHFGVDPDAWARSPDHGHGLLVKCDRLKERLDHALEGELAAQPGVLPAVGDVGEETCAHGGQFLVGKRAVGAQAAGQVLGAGGDGVAGHSPVDQLGDHPQADQVPEAEQPGQLAGQKRGPAGTRARPALHPAPGLAEQAGHLGDVVYAPAQVGDRAGIGQQWEGRAHNGQRNGRLCHRTASTGRAVGWRP